MLHTGLVEHTGKLGMQLQAARECARPRGRAGDPVLQPLPARPSAGGGEARRREEMEEVYG